MAASVFVYLQIGNYSRMQTKLRALTIRGEPCDQTGCAGVSTL